MMWVCGVKVCVVWCMHLVFDVCVRLCVCGVFGVGGSCVVWVFSVLLVCVSYVGLSVLCVVCVLCGVWCG